MNAPFTLEDLAVSKHTGHISPERLDILKRVFDTVCEESAIPPNAKGERNDLARRLLTASVTVEHESLLLAYARRAVASYRR